MRAIFILLNVGSSEVQERVVIWSLQQSRHIVRQRRSVAVLRWFYKSFLSCRRVCEEKTAAAD
jgi:hypothetical protein